MTAFGGKIARSLRAGVVVTALVGTSVAVLAVPISANATTRPGATAPGKPTHVVATAGDAQAKLVWSAPSDTGGQPVQYYVVRYAHDGTTSWHAGPTVYDTVTIIKNLNNGTAYVFEVRAYNGSSLGAYSDPSSPVTPHGSHDSVSIAAAKSATIRWGRSTVLSTKLTDTTKSSPLASTDVTLLARPAGSSSFAKVAGPTTDSHGNAHAKVSPTVTTSYRWSYAGDGTHNAATSGTSTVTVAQAVTAALSKSKIKHGKRTAVYGTVSPSNLGDKVTLQRRHGGGWKRVGHPVKIDVQRLPNGQHGAGYVLRYKAKQPGKQVLRVTSHGTSTTVGGHSKHLRLTVR